MSSNKNAIIAGIAFAIIFIGSISLVMLVNLKEEKHEFELAWWQKTLIYHVYLPSYKDTNGDGFGDIKGKMFFLTFANLILYGIVPRKLNHYYLLKGENS